LNDDGDSRRLGRPSVDGVRWQRPDDLEGADEQLFGSSVAKRTPGPLEKKRCQAREFDILFLGPRSLSHRVHHHVFLMASGRS
jgi:hypothetical protein